MRVAFITPTLHSLGPRWYADPQIVKLGAPTIAGFLQAKGYDRLRQYDFEVQVFDLEAADPGALDLRSFFDDAAVDRFLGSDDPILRGQTELLLDTLRIEEADVFAFSCSSVLEIYADMHAAGNANLCICKILKERFPQCKTVIGGLQMSPDELHRAEYERMLERCPFLDFAVEGKGEKGMLHVLEHLEQKRTLEDNGREYRRVGRGMLLGRTHSRKFHVPKAFREDDARKALPLAPTTPTEKPLGDHERRTIENPSVHVTPWFDPVNIDLRKISGAELLRRYHLGDEWREQFAPHLGDRIAILPLIFLEGCNAHCAFCGYSMTNMDKRDVTDVVRALATLRERHDVRYFHFLNTNINGYLRYAEAFCDALIDAKLDILWSDCANLWALTPRLLEKMVQSGCRRLTFGLECPSPRMLDYIKKGITVEQAHERLRMAHELGIWNHLLLITGLPTETEEDVRHFIDFLERAAEYSHGYSVSSFYLISTSLMGAFPERFGLELLPNPSGLLEDQAFNEVGGLTWSEKKKQIIESTRVITQTIRRLKGDPKYSSGAIDLELLFWLYDRLGPERKADVVRAYEEAWLGEPVHPKYLERNVRDLLATPPEGLRRVLGTSALVPQIRGVETRGDRLVVPFGAGRGQVELELTCGDEPGNAGLARGEAMGINVTARSGAEEALHALAGPASELARALTRSGWSVRRDATDELAGGIRIERGRCALDLSFAHVQPDAPVFLRRGDLGMIYSVPRGFEDATQQPGVQRLLTIVGEHVLGALATMGEKPGSPAVNAGALAAIARELVRELEERLAAGDPRRAGKKLGRRHGDKFSRVTA